MEEGTRSKLQDMVASGQVRLLPLTFPQRELWETSPVPPGDATNNIRSFIDITGPVTHAMCSEAVQLVAMRQEAMRTTFLPGKERPVQLLRRRAEARVQYREMSDPRATDAGIIETMDEGFRQPFDLARGPLYRLQMVRRGPDHHALGLTIHHAIADGWTVTSFVEDLYAACIAIWRNSGKDMSRVSGMRDSLPPLTTTYSEWGAAERARWPAQEVASHASYWKERLAGASMLFDAGSAPLGSLEKWVTSLPSELAEPVRAAAKRAGVTLFSALLAAFRLALFRWKGARDVVVGTPVAGRQKTALKETMGSFSATVPLRAKINPDSAFGDLARATHESSVEDFSKAMPFAELVAAVERGLPRRRHAIFDVRFAVQNHPFPGIEIPGMSTRLQNLSSGTSRFDIACELTEDGKKLELIWLHRPPVVTKSDIGELDRLFRAVLEDVGRWAAGSMPVTTRT